MKKGRISVKDSAKIAKVKPRTIRRWIIANKIKAYKRHGYFWEVDEKSLLEFIR